MNARAWLILALCAAFWLPPASGAENQAIPAPTHGNKKAKKGYDYDQSQYKAYHVLTGEHHYRFDKDGNPVDEAPAKKVAKGKRKKKAAAADPAQAPAAPAELAHAHFASSVGSAGAPPAPAGPGAPRSEGPAPGSAPVVGGACAGDTCSQPPAGQ